MMKKTIKKLLAALLAVAMVCAMAIPAFADNYWETEEDLGKNHCYDAFQIFTGDVSDDNTISNVAWGSSIAHPNEFLLCPCHSCIQKISLKHHKMAHGKWHDYNGIFASLGFVDGDCIS